MHFPSFLQTQGQIVLYFISLLLRARNTQLPSKGYILLNRATLLARTVMQQKLIIKVLEARRVRLAASRCDLNDSAEFLSLTNPYRAYLFIFTKSSPVLNSLISINTFKTTLHNNNIIYIYIIRYVVQKSDTEIQIISNKYLL